MDKVLFSNLVYFPNSSLDEDARNYLKKSLTVTPKVTSDYNDDPADIILYSEEESRFGVPRQYFLKNKTKDYDMEFDVSNGVPIDVPFKGELREHQVAPYEQFMALTKQNDFFGGIISLQPGRGKTILALKLISELKMRTLVIVHKEFLMNQWIERIKEYLPNARVGKIQQDCCQFEDIDIAVGMVHSVAGIDRYPKELYSAFGLICYDEVHRVACSTWSKAAPKFNPRYSIGLSATTYRSDRTEKVFLYYVGDVIYKDETHEMKPIVKRVKSEFKIPELKGIKPKDITDGFLINLVSKNNNRNELIKKSVIDAVKAGRKILVVSHRLDQLNTLERKVKIELEKEGIELDSGFYTGGKKQEDLDNAAKAQAIFATIQLTKEGLDLPDIDMLIMATPVGNVVQIVGRIQRAVSGKKTPIVVDIVDWKVEKLRGMYFYRYKYYKNQGWLKNGK